MEQTNISTSLLLTVLYNDFMTVGTWWNFQDVISPFNRLYLITDGKGMVNIRGQRMELSAGDLFLIPKFTFHSYECDNSMTHYYICFTDEALSGKKLFNVSTLQLKKKATDLDYCLMQRFFQLNPDRKLPSVDPKDYDNKTSLLRNPEDITTANYIRTIESTGILMQLYSRFMTEQLKPQYKQTHTCEKMEDVITYIDNHLDSKMTVADLARITCLTLDHFSKVFKRVMGIPPSEYLMEKRIERAQTLLLTSDMSVSNIAEKVGISDLSQFSRLFSRLVHCSPREYRKKLLL